ncbi:hypothetical protein ACOBR2_08795 [Telmatobacter bradus]|jgi:hypothetical protein|uniref:hypothetical protein n=1 Tax=Telmatobacter bradus TaxID=474953 RepID=UPI003B42FE47
MISRAAYDSSVLTPARSTPMGTSGPPIKWVVAIDGPNHATEFALVTGCKISTCITKAELRKGLRLCKNYPEEKILPADRLIFQTKLY